MHGDTDPLSREDADPDIVRVNSGVQTFKKVWCQFEPPRRSFFAHRQRAVGTLTVGPDGVRFTSEKFSWRCEDIDGIGIGGAGNDIVNRWIVADVGECAHGSVVFLKDGRWLGWHSIFTRADDDILEVLRGWVTGATDGTSASVAKQLQSTDRISQWAWQHPWLTAVVLGSLPAIIAVLAAQVGDWTTAVSGIALVVIFFVLFGSAALRRSDKR